MKRILILLCLPMIGFGQLTMIPDANFEQELINLGYDFNLNGSVYTASIDTVTSLNVNGLNIADLTGIEDFILLESLYCNGNYLHILDVSQNTALTYLGCSHNLLTTLDVSQNTALTNLYCRYNQLTSLDVSNNTACGYLDCSYNQLTSLDMRNGNNMNMSNFYATDNPNLTCINVDNATWSFNNWTVANQNIDLQHYFSNNCSGTLIEEHTTNKELLRTIDILGRETTNNPLFYIYDDGTVEKRIVIE